MLRRGVDGALLAVGADALAVGTFLVDLSRNDGTIAGLADLELWRMDALKRTVLVTAVWVALATMFLWRTRDDGEWARVARCGAAFGMGLFAFAPLVMWFSWAENGSPAIVEASSSGMLAWLVGPILLTLFGGWRVGITIVRYVAGARSASAVSPRTG